MEDAIDNNAARNNNEAAPGWLQAALGWLQAARGLLFVGWPPRITLVLFGIQLAMFVLNFLRVEDHKIRIANLALGLAILWLALIKVITFGGLAKTLTDSQHHVSYMLLMTSIVQAVLVIIDMIQYEAKVKHPLHYCNLGFYLSFLNIIMLLYPLLRCHCLGDSRE